MKTYGKTDKHVTPVHDFKSRTCISQMDDNLYSNSVNDSFQFTVKKIKNIQNKKNLQNMLEKIRCVKERGPVITCRMQDNANQGDVLAVVNEIEVGQAHIRYADTG